MSTLILGRGHVGKALTQSNESFLFTNRKKSHPGSLTFDLENKTTWKNIPKTEKVIWTFPAKPLELVEEFYEAHLKEVKNLIVLASTSRYINKRQKEKVDETTPVNTDIVRVKGEEFLKSKGALILCLAGIYNEERNPLNWLKKNLIRNPKKVVNLIHTDDIVAIILHFLENPCPGDSFNLSDGFPRTWQEIGDRLGFEFRMPGEREVSKLLDNSKIRSVLPDGFKFKALYDLWE